MDLVKKLLCALCCFAAAACAEAEDPSTGSGGVFHQRVALAPLDGGEGSVTPRSLKRYSAPEGERNHSWVIEDRIDPKSFNRVVVSLTNRRQARVKLVLKRDGQRVFGVPSVALERSPQSQVVVFDLPSLRRRDIHPTELEVIVTASRADYRFHSVDLVSMPVHALLPSGDGALVSAAGEARRVVGVTSDRPLSGVAPLVPGARLSLSVLQPEGQRYPGQRPRFRVRARDVDGVVVEAVIPMGSSVQGEERWFPVGLDLSGLSGEQVWVEVSLEVRGGEPGACVMELPYVHVVAQGARTVLLITSDTHRADALGVAASAHPVRTPHLDELAGRAVRFTDCYSQTNVTSPSHVAIMTGTSPRDTGIISNTGHMAEAALTLAERFREHGFLTYGVASVRHLGPLGTGLGQGFERMAAPGGEVWDAEVSVAQLESWLPEADGRPLFVWLHLFDAHAPYAPPGEFHRRYYPEGRDPFDAATAGGVEVDPRWFGAALRGLKDPEYALAQYRAEVDYLDGELGRLLGRPRFREGVVAFTADHGESFGSGGVWFSHVGLFPATLHVPLLLAWPGGPRGEVVEHPVELLDLGRTLLDLAGFQGDEFPGRSLLGAVGGAAVEAPRFSLSANGMCAAVAVDGWQLTLNLRAHDYRGMLAREHHQVELFHIATDWGCQVDVWEREPAQAKALRRLLIVWLADTRGSSWARAGAEDAEALAQLAALGYTMDVPETEDRSWIDVDCAWDWCRRFGG